MRAHLAMGTADQVHAREYQMVAFDLTIFGCLLLMGVYLLVLYWFRTEDRLQQILYNLVGNAIKSTDAGKIRVYAAVKDATVTVAVNDSGIGIPEDKQETIFKSFEQVETGESKVFGGTGLGLSIAKRLVELHEGTISVESQAGLGATFYFTLPICSDGRMAQRDLQFDRIKNVPLHMESDVDPIAPHVDLFNVEKNEIAQANVMIVDDDVINLQVAANLLTVGGISATMVSSGADALKRIADGERPDLILMDIMMPQVTGIEVCRNIREQYSLSEMPIIMLTGKDRMADLVDGFVAGANDYLAKPFSKEELRARVRAHLQVKQACEVLIEKEKLEKEIERRIAQREKALVQAPKSALESLRYQLNPHFLFNALASIRGAVLRNKQTAHRMISHLAEFSRLALSRGAMETLTVVQELEIVRHTWPWNRCVLLTT